jgi:uncharacterized membrane protein YqjE
MEGADGPEMVHRPETGESMKDLMRRLGTDTSGLVREEMALARLEMKENARAFALDSVKAGVGLGLALVGGLALSAFLVIVIGNALDGAYWAGALIVGGVFALVGGVLAWRAIKDLKERGVAPEQTVESLKEGKRWASAEAQDFRRELRS